MSEEVLIDKLLIQDDPNKVNEVRSFIQINKIKVRKIVGEQFMMNSILYQKIDGKWNIHYYNYTRHMGTAFAYLYLSLISILRRERIWFRTLNPILLNTLNQRILQDHFPKHIHITGAEKFQDDYLQGVYLGFEIYRSLKEKLITPSEAMSLFRDCDFLPEHAGYCAALMQYGAKSEAKTIIDFFWESDRSEFQKTAERIDDCLRKNELNYADFFYIQQNHFRDLRPIDFEKKLQVFMKDELSQKEYDIAISFAGEDRKIARELSTQLQNRSYKVFYDEFEKSKMWGKNLYEYLTEVYRTKSKYCLIIISEHYVKKAWPRLERKSAQSRAFEEENEYILPLRLDDSEVPGLLPTVGYIDYRIEGDENITAILIEKINNYGS